MTTIHRTLQRELFFGILALGTIVSTSLGAETLSQAVQDSLLSHPDILASRAQLQGSEADYSSAKGAYLPTLDLLYARGKETTDSPTTRLASGSDVTLDRNEAGLVLRQSLYDAPRFNEVDRAAAVRDASREGADAIQSRAMFDVIRGFLNVASNRLITGVAASSLAAHEKIAEKVGQRSAAGAGSQTDTRQAEGRVALARVNYLQYQSAMKNSEYEYQSLVGHRPDATLVDDLVLASADIVDMESAVSEALRNHPQVKKAQYELEAAREAQAVMRGRYYPSVGLEARVNNNENIDGIAGVHDSRSVMLRVNFNLLNGGSDWAKSRSAAEKFNETLQRLESSRRQVAEAVRKAWTSREIAVERLQYLTAQEEKTTTVRNDYVLQFDIGKRSLLDVLDLEKELQIARRDKIRAEYDQRLADISLFYAMGRLTSNVVASSK